MSLALYGLKAAPSEEIPADPEGTIYLADEGAKSLKVNGSISSGTNQLVVDDVAGWSVADWVIVPTGSYTRGQVAAGGAHPNASAAGVTNMTIPTNAGTPIAGRRARDTSDGNRVYVVSGKTGISTDGSNLLTSIGATEFTVGGKVLMTGSGSISAGTTISSIEADGASTLRLSNNVTGSGSITLYGFTPIALDNVYETYCQPRPALVKISAIDTGTKTFTLTDRSGGAWTASADYTGDVYFDNIQIFKDTIETTQGDYKLPLGNDIGISRHIRIATHTLDAGSLFGHGRTQSRLIVPKGCPCLVLDIFEIDNFTVRDLAYQGNHAEVGYGLYWSNYHNDSESPDAIYSATHYGVIQNSCDSNIFERIDGADVFTGACSTLATSNSITRNMTYTHNYTMEKYYQWHFQHANGDNNLTEDITIICPGIIASYESFQGVNDVFRRISGPCFGAMNSAGGFVVEDCTIIFPEGCAENNNQSTILNSAALDLNNNIDAAQNPARTATFDLTANTVTVPDSGRDFENDDVVWFGTSGALPTGLTAGDQWGAQVYYVVNVQAVSGGNQTMQVAATKGGSAIDLSGSPSGSHTMRLFISRLTALGGTVTGTTIEFQGFSNTITERATHAISVAAYNVIIEDSTITTCDDGGANGADTSAIRITNVIGVVIDGVTMPGQPDIANNFGKISLSGGHTSVTVQNCIFDQAVTLSAGDAVIDGGGNKNLDLSPRTVPT